MMSPRTPTSTSDSTSTVIAPKLGGIQGNTVWIGGPPKITFDGPYELGPPTPYCFRGLDCTHESKNYKARVHGLDDTSFKKDDKDYSLQSFADDVLRHMESHGMDTIFYMCGVDSSGEGGLNLFTHHSRFTEESVAKHLDKKKKSGAFDYYQQKAMQESYLCLVNALSTPLKDALRVKIKKRPSGPELWMAIVAEVQTESLQRCADDSKWFDEVKLASYQGENVDEFAKAVGDVLARLEIDDQLPPLHLRTLVDKMSTCSVLDFKVFMMGRRTQVDTFLRDAAGKTPDVVKNLPTYVHYETLLSEAKTKYHELKAKWGPAKATDPETALKAEMKKLQAKIATLDQKLKASDGGKRGDGKACYSCGKVGFTKKTCPDCSKKPNSNGSGNSNGSNGGNQSSPPAGQGKWAAPKTGEPHEKEINGELHKYCGKCRGGKGRWTKGTSAHLTANHQAGFRTKKDEASTGTGTPAAKVARFQGLSMMGDWDDSDSA